MPVNESNKRPALLELHVGREGGKKIAIGSGAVSVTKDDRVGEEECPRGL